MEKENPKQKRTKALPLLLLILLLIAGGIFLTRDVFFEKEKPQEKQEQEIENQEVESIPVENIQKEGTGIEVVENFPEDIPVLEGDVVRSEVQTWMAITVLLVDTSVEETFKLYKEAFEETSWIVQETNETDEFHDIIFNNGIEFGEEGHRNGRVAILHDEKENRTSVTVRESF